MLNHNNLSKLIDSLKQFMDYSNRQTLLDALDAEDCKTVQKCILNGQSLQKIFRGGNCLLVDAIRYANRPRINTIFAFKKHIDLDFKNHCDWTALMHAAIHEDYSTVHFLIQNGADLNAISGLSGETAFKMGNSVIQLMLLSAGADPKVDPNSKRTITSYRNVKEKAKEWLSSLEMAKNLFEEIFDNLTLENLLCDFVYVEHYLKKLI